MADTTNKVPSTPAGKDDNVEIVAVNMQQIVKDGEKDELSTPNYIRVECISSKDIAEGVTIQAYDGGKPQEKEQEI